MKTFDKMTADELKFYSYLVEDSKNWWPCEGDIDVELAKMFDLYTGFCPDAEACIEKFNEGKEDYFWYLLDSEIITLRDGVKESEARDEYLKGPKGNFLDMIEEDEW